MNYDWMTTWSRRFASDFPATAPARIDLLRALHAVPQARRADLGARPGGGSSGSRPRYSTGIRGQPELTDPRVEIPAELRAELAERRRHSGVTNRALCASVGIRQPVTFYAWEKGLSRPTLPHFEAYLGAIGANADDVMSRATLAPSRLERIWKEQYTGSRPKRRSRLRAPVRPRSRRSGMVCVPRGSAR